MHFILIFAIMSAFSSKMEVSSPSFNDQAYIPVKFTCEGEGVNPELSIKDVPKDAKSLVLIMDDPDAPRKTFDHWVVYNIPVREHVRIPENSNPGISGKNGKGENNYVGPCPPRGTHRYFFKVYALNTTLDLAAGADKKQVEKAMDGHIMAEAQLVGLYKKTK